MSKSKKQYDVLPEGRTPDIWDKMMHLPLLRLLNPFFQKHRSVLMYLFFGGVTTLIDLGITVGAELLGIHELVRVPVAWVVAVFVAFATNRVWVFNSQTRGAAAYVKQLVSFYAGRAVTLLIEFVFTSIFVTWLDQNVTFIWVAAKIIILILNYVFSKLFVFKKQDNPQTPTQD